MSIFQKVTLKTLKENRTRTIVTIIGIILSVAMFTAITTSISSFQNYMLEFTRLREGNWHASIHTADAGTEGSLSDKKIEKITFLENIGYAHLANGHNPDKPYLFIGGMDKNADGMLPLQLIDGRLPENENELLLPAHLADNGGVNCNLNDTLSLDIGQRTGLDASGSSSVLGQETPYLYTLEELEEQELPPEELKGRETEIFTPQFSHTYTVVGFYERPSIEKWTAPGYTALTVSSADISAKADNTLGYTAYLRFKHINDTIPWMEEHYRNNYGANYDLLRMSGSSGESHYNAVLYSLAAVLIAIILFGSISLIYNAFSISVTERTKQFGLLASVGATRKQLSHSVLFEAFILCVIGIPLGILAGIVGIGITLKLLGASISSVFLGRNAFPLTLHVSLSSILIAAVIGLFTVLISAWIPAKRSARLSPIDAIRMTNDISIRPGKVKTSRLTYLLFGLPGMLASKNFKRNRKKYRATVVSLFVSVVLFISASSFCSYLTNSAGDVLSDSGYDIWFHYYPKDDAFAATRSLDEILEKLSSLKDVTKAAYRKSTLAQIYMDEKFISREYTDFLAENFAAEAEILKPNEQGQLPLDINIFFINDSTYRDFLVESGLSPEEFMDPQAPVSVACNFIRFYHPEKEKYSSIHVLDSKSADAIMMQAQTPEGKNPVPQALHIGAVTEEMPFFLGDYYSDGLKLMYPVSAMDTILGTEQADYMRTIESTDFYFTATDHWSAAEDISEAVRAMELPGGYSVYDYAEDAAQTRTLLLIINVFSYGFITLISLIAVANVFNTISTNIQLRKREFAMLKSTGMTPKGFTVMMCYECLLYGIKGLLYGLPVSVVMTWFIYRAVSNGLETSFYIPWYSLIITVGSVFLVVGCTMIYSMHKIGKENVIDNLKNDNV